MEPPVKFTNALPFLCCRLCSPTSWPATTGNASAPPIADPAIHLQKGPPRHGGKQHLVSPHFVSHSSV